MVGDREKEDRGLERLAADGDVHHRGQREPRAAGYRSGCLLAQFTAHAAAVAAHPERHVGELPSIWGGLLCGNRRCHAPGPVAPMRMSALVAGPALPGHPAEYGVQQPVRWRRGRWRRRGPTFCLFGGDPAEQGGQGRERGKLGPALGADGDMAVDERPLRGAAPPEDICAQLQADLRASGRHGLVSVSRVSALAARHGPAASAHAVGSPVLGAVRGC